jgi:hypothetical protein
VFFFLLSMPRPRRKEVEVQVDLRSFTSLRLHMELRSGKVLFTVSNTAMSAPDEQQTLVGYTPSGPKKVSLYARLQAMTKGYLWFCVAASILLLACGLVFFPQKTWNRLMMALFGCVTLHIRGKDYKFCEQVAPQGPEGPTFL